MNLLFICSKNRWRSPTAENIFSKYEGINTRSAGTSPKAKIKVSKTDLSWADLIFVMENKHQAYLSRKFPDLSRQKIIKVLHIPDKYQYMDEKLIKILDEKVKSFLQMI